jgi:gliding motility-associated protein GldL
MRNLAIFFESEKGKRLKNMFIGLGAAVVMMGALFKLESWPGASIMLICGLSVEAFIFALQGMLPPHKDYYWEKIYPDLDIAPEVEGGVEAHHGPHKSVTEELDSMLAKANVESKMIERLGANLGKLGTSIEKMAEMGDVSAATSQYAAKTKEATAALASMKDAYVGATASIQALGGASGDAKNFHTQMQLVTKNLASLNSIYEVELQDASKHISAINKFYGTLASTTDNLQASVADTKVYKEQMNKLANNLASLNAVYGGMLSAMSVKH